MSTEGFVLDCDASSSRCGRPTKVSPCLTRSCGAGLWLLGRGTRISADACCRLRGIQAEALVKPAREVNLRRLMGNSMTLSVVESLLRAAIVSTGCCSPPVPVRWFSGASQASLVSKAWGIDFPTSVLALLPQRVLRHLPSVVIGSDMGPSANPLATGSCQASQDPREPLRVFCQMGRPHILS